KTILLLVSIAWIGFASTGLSVPKTDEERQKIVDSLKWRTDQAIPLEGDMATIKLQSGYRYLDSQDATKVLTDLWGNPRQKTLGMIFPPEDSASSGVWGVIVERFEDEGFVKDEDADKIDPAKMLKELKE